MPKGQRNRSAHKLSQTSYATIYGVSRDTIARIVKSGTDPDDEGAVKEWLKTRARGPGKLKTTSTEPRPNSHSRARVKRSIGLAGIIIALQNAEAEVSNRYRAAMAQQEHGEIRFWREEWVTICAALLKIEESNPEIEREKRESVSLPEVEMFVDRTYGAIREAVEAMPQRLAAKLLGLEAADILVQLQDEVKNMLKPLRNRPEWTHGS